jgi:hypothetical protein
MKTATLALSLIPALTLCPPAQAKASATVTTHTSVSSAVSEQCESSWGYAHAGYNPAVTLEVCREGQYRGFLRITNETNRRAYVCYAVQFASGTEESGCATLNAGGVSSPSCSPCNGHAYTRSVSGEIRSFEFRD